MRMSFACTSDHDPPHPMVGHSVRKSLERGLCPVCAGQALIGSAAGGLDWARCPCCQAEWRLENDRFAVRSGQLVEEWI